MNKVLKYTLIILLTMAMVALLYQFRSMIVLLVISLALTATSRPFLNRLSKWRVSGFIAQLLLLVLLVGVFVGIIFLIGPALMKELQTLSTSLFTRYYHAYPTWQEIDSWQKEFLSTLPEPNMLGAYMLGTEDELSMPTALNFTQGVAAFFGKIFMVFIFSLYWAQSQDRFIRMLASLFPAHQRGRIRETWKKAESAVSTYIRQELTLGLIAALLLGFGYSLMGLPYPITMTIVGFISWFIPLIGFALVLLPMYIATLSAGWSMFTLALSYTLLIFLLLKFWLKPKYLGDIRYSSFLITFWIVILGSFLGLGGFLAGPVVALALHAVWGQYLKYRLMPTGRKGLELQIAALQERYATAYKQYAALEKDHPSPQLGSIFERLKETLHQAETLTREQKEVQTGS